MAVKTMSMRMYANVIWKENIRLTMWRYKSGIVSLFEIFTGSLYWNIVIIKLSIFNANHITVILNH